MNPAFVATVLPHGDGKGRRLEAFACPQGQGQRSRPVPSRIIGGRQLRRVRWMDHGSAVCHWLRFLFGSAAFCCVLACACHRSCDHRALGWELAARPDKRSPPAKTRGINDQFLNKKIMTEMIFFLWMNDYWEMMKLESW